MATLGGVLRLRHFLTTATYVTNLVFLIGLGIAIDYSCCESTLREELLRNGDVEAAIVRTMRRPPAARSSFSGGHRSRSG